MVEARTGSAPLKAMFQRLRSRPARSSAVIRPVQRSYPKLGPPLRVPPYRDMAWSQRRGRWRNAAGAISTPGNPLYRGWMMP